MPAISKAQVKFFRGIVSGKIKKKGLTKKQAAEFLKGTNIKSLPTRVKKTK